MEIIIVKTCNSTSLALVLNIVKRILLLIEVVVPIILMIFVVLELIHMMKNPDDQKSKKKLFNKFFATITIFMIPVLMNATMYMLGESTTFSSCWKNSKEISTGSTYMNNQKERKKPISEDDYEKGKKAASAVSFNLEHALQVGDYVHAKENATLQWDGQNLGPIGGSVGAYTEAVNIFNETDYRIYEVYNTLVKYHPELKEKHDREPYQMTDVNHYYHMKATIISRNMDAVKQALLEGKLVQAYGHPNVWRNSKGEEIVWPGDHGHWGLIFYFDGTYYHMKNAGSIQQKDAIYTEEQLKEWLDSKNLPHRPIVYEKE